MRTDHHYRVDVRWLGNRGTGTSGPRAFGRDTEISVDGLPSILASADKPFHGAHDRWNPEQLLIASLVQCHLLSYLYVATREGVVVESYADAATGLLRTNADGGGAFVSATLRPEVTISAGDPDRARRLHDDAAKLCFINASLAFPVAHEPTIQVVAGKATPTTQPE
ncbi:organic hydroperoxide reductase OsmC/OhrA [Microbacteriaceae bacterium SG_E_30_P1]|uniref:Organic hydroperoxide reductase OsmC/OhrA n=1 Tax=Antiquaquibacter oligotrophicus TaxID=2880260 RepID=A0ABT6KKQ7_9MICO|nr:OsmC family protein [Antiquaquibacter oligotrophicus]MDH6180588.1 organic hydroperoxide reductase OsmC/OhrA [Antiquaquibacter oligotrophicus]UDF13679.1 OsmC family protein [Antiquaquibacter oligotrophicus]